MPVTQCCCPCICYVKYHIAYPSPGRGARRAPYDFIFTEDGISLRKVAETLPALEGYDAESAAGGVYGPRAAKKRRASGKSIDDDSVVEYTG